MVKRVLDAMCECGMPWSNGTDIIQRTAFICILLFMSCCDGLSRRPPRFDSHRSAGRSSKKAAWHSCTLAVRLSGMCTTCFTDLVAAETPHLCGFFGSPMDMGAFWLPFSRSFVVSLQVS